MSGAAQGERARRCGAECERSRPTSTAAISGGWKRQRRAARARRWGGLSVASGCLVATPNSLRGIGPVYKLLAACGEQRSD